ncbi:MAG: carboxylesterase family protein [Gammaproteobacteria bacterium]|nr:carboxylesterase family protein [Gammaproteobacteria bacterium]
MPAATWEAQPVAATTAGAVRGTGGAVLTFKGIPYAQAPLGPLRWRAPQSHPPWPGVRDATHFGDDCMQLPYVIPTGQKPSEDCLTVNVWTPAEHREAALPVVVFIYGGGFIGGSCAYPLYDGSKLAARGVVVVCFNYRVGVFGFLAHPRLSAEAPQKSSGNYGLLDQLAALRWVRDNIGAFGGDPRRITVLGESAGAVSIALLMSSPLAQGLFARAVAQSPLVPQLATLAEAETQGARLGTDLDALRHMSASALLAHDFDFFPIAPHTVMAHAVPLPVIDGYVLPTQPRAALRACAAGAVPSVIGISADEGRMFSGDLHVETVASYRAWISRTFGPLAAQLLRLAPATTDADVPRAVALVLGDATFDESARLLARSLSRCGLPAYAYVFGSNIAGRAQPATHSEALPYLFGNLREPSFIPHPPPSAADQELSALMMSAVARFATGGDPNGAGLPRWSRYDASEPYLQLATRVRLGHAWHKSRLDALQPFYSEDPPAAQP